MKMSEILEVKRKIESALGTKKFALYLKTAKKVYSLHSDQISLEEFYEKGSPLFAIETIHLHSQFCALISNICDTLNPITTVEFSRKSHRNKASGSVKRKLSMMEEMRPMNRKNNLPTGRSRQMQQRPVPDTSMLSTVYQVDTNVSSTSELSDVSIVHGHVLLTALENDLALVDEEPVKLLISAIRIQLKTIIMAVLNRRSPYKLKDGRFRYKSNFYCHSEPSVTGSPEVGRPDDDPNMALRATCSDVPADLNITSDTKAGIPQSPVSLLDLYRALMIHRDLIPSRAVYGPIMERIGSRLDHPARK